jgi:recombination protein RecA
MERTKKPEGITKEIISTSKGVKKKKEIVSLINSGCTVLDLALGGGLPFGKIINIVGDNSSGKTLLSIEMIAQARSILGDKLKWFYDDAESGFSFNTENMYGFPIIDDKEEMSHTVEDFDTNLDKQMSLLKKDEKLIYVLDTLDGLSSEAEIKKAEAMKKARRKGKADEEKGSYNLEKQKAMSALFRLKSQAIKKSNCLLIIISQVRLNIGVMFGNKYSRTGGKALDFYAAQIIWLAEVEKKLKKKRAVGITIKAKITKNKIGKPFRECFIDILFDYGVDDISSNLIFYYDLRTEKGKLKEKTTDNKWGKKEYTLRALVKKIESENSESKLKNLVVEKWQEIEEQISSKDRKRKWQ